ncbi:hypothetical protein EXIGLDRAFT_756854 [Exidia glandulosa HHB12029]|uniref:Uncharacterized protein n=1 Tax=Exidia glandulosa HHB12029 TaxID=1314781 RepID=A0A165B0D8_EXIGL|nr:hypothetical protein EXIGLDRAFT_756854 [Exidia glandulosa HHB12029]
MVWTAPSTRSEDVSRHDHKFRRRRREPRSLVQTPLSFLALLPGPQKGAQRRRRSRMKASTLRKKGRGLYHALKSKFSTKKEVARARRSPTPPGSPISYIRVSIASYSDESAEDTAVAPSVLIAVHPPSTSTTTAPVVPQSTVPLAPVAFPPPPLAAPTHVLSVLPTAVSAPVNSTNVSTVAATALTDVSLSTTSPPASSTSSSLFTPSSSAASFATTVSNSPSVSTLSVSREAKQAKTSAYASSSAIPVVEGEPSSSARGPPSPGGSTLAADTSHAGLSCTLGGQEHGPSAVGSQLTNATSMLGTQVVHDTTVMEVDSLSRGRTTYELDAHAWQTQDSVCPTSTPPPDSQNAIAVVDSFPVSTKDHPPLENDKGDDEHGRTEGSSEPDEDGVVDMDIDTDDEGQAVENDEDGYETPRPPSAASTTRTIRLERPAVGETSSAHGGARKTHRRHRQPSLFVAEGDFSSFLGQVQRTGGYCAKPTRRTQGPSETVQAFIELHQHDNIVDVKKPLRRHKRRAPTLRLTAETLRFEENEGCMYDTLVDLGVDNLRFVHGTGVTSSTFARLVHRFASLGFAHVALIKDGSKDRCTIAIQDQNGRERVFFGCTPHQVRRLCAEPAFVHAGEFTMSDDLPDCIYEALEVAELALKAVKLQLLVCGRAEAGMYKRCTYVFSMPDLADVVLAPAVIYASSSTGPVAANEVNNNHTLLPKLLSLIIDYPFAPRVEVAH